MAGADNWKTAELAQLFLNDVRGAIPLATEQLEVITRLVAHARPKLDSFLDLGCGDGILGCTLLRRFPQARGIFVDFSAPMLAAARAKVPPAGAHRFVLADLGQPAWRAALGPGARCDAVVSGLAIHHLPDERKRALYGEIHDVLAPGGIFLNFEHVSSPTPWLRALHDEIFVDALYAHELRRGGPRTRAEVAAVYAERRDNTGNLLAPVETQCAWLRELGFAHVDCYFKFFELAIFGGVRGG